MMRPRLCCDSVFGREHVSGCDFEPRPDRPIDYVGPVIVVPELPSVSIGLDEQLRAGIAAQLHALADLLDPSKAVSR